MYDNCCKRVVVTSTILIIMRLSRHDRKKCRESEVTEYCITTIVIIFTVFSHRDAYLKACSGHAKKSHTRFVLPRVIKWLVSMNSVSTTDQLITVMMIKMVVIVVISMHT